ncbi:hypothetical protein F4680DRAFT_470701 [Xylaria scruposa]|nr:hypothetical protein F4680DRAFT_470701 [Xylaria scruposa]
MAGVQRRMWNRTPSFYHTLTQTKVLAIVIEVILAISVLVIHSLAYPENCRKILWEIGGEAGWNSNPRLRIYFYANYQDPPEIPLAWTQKLSQANLGVALVAVSACIAKLVLTFFNQSDTLVFAFYDILLSTLWLWSVIAQSSGDFSDA